jgi:hypothetical protein
LHGCIILPGNTQEYTVALLSISDGIFGRLSPSAKDPIRQAVGTTASINDHRRERQEALRATVRFDLLIIESERPRSRSERGYACLKK